MRRYLITSCLVLAVFTLILATQAKADSIDNFTYQAGGNTFTWQLPSSPTISPDSFLPGLLFGVTDVAYSENDIPQNPAVLSFLSLNFGGGLSLGDLIQGTLIVASDFQIYCGSEDAPTFLTGTFGLTDYASDGNGLPATLTITAVPEPSSLMLLATGMLALLGLALKKTVVSRLNVLGA
jgi:hypothetical protein